MSSAAGWPVSGSLLTPYGGKLPDGRSSTGILIGAAAGTPVKAVADAKSQAEALLSDANARAEAAERESQAKVENLDREAKTRYDETIGKLASDRVSLEKKIEDLRGYEKEYRGRLKSWISDQLAQLDDGGSREQQPIAVTTSPGD